MVILSTKISDQTQNYIDQKHNNHSIVADKNQILTKLSPWKIYKINQIIIGCIFHDY